MAEANKPEKLGFVRLYNTRLPLAAVEVQKPGALKGIGTMRHDIRLVYVAHYCWEGGLLLVSQHIDDAPAGWLDREHTSPAMTSHVCATETAAVDRIVRMKGEAWENAHDRVEAAIGKNKPVSVTRYDADVEVPVWARAEVAYLKAVASEFVFKRPGAEALYADQRVLLVELVDAVLAGGRAVLHPWLADDWEAATAGDARLRVAVDQVASLTDVSAVRWHERLCRPGGA